jgi:hypothetical protein
MKAQTLPEQPAQRGPRLDVWLGVGFVALGLLVAYGWLSGALDNLKPHVFGLRFEIAAAGLGVWLTILTVWWARRNQRFDPFEAPVWLSINIYVQIILNIWLAQRVQSSTIPWVRQNAAELGPRVVLLYGVALTVLWLAYILAHEYFSEKTKPASLPLLVPNYTVIGLVWFAGWLVQVFSVLSGRVGYLAAQQTVWSNYLDFLEAITWTAIGLLVMLYFQKPTRKGGAWLAVVVAADLLLNLIVGSKLFALHIVWLSIFFFYATRRLPWRLWLAGAVLVVLFVPVVTNYRGYLKLEGGGGGVALPQRVQALGSALSDTLARPVSGLFGDTQSTLQDRQGSIFHISASVMYMHPEQMPYLGAEMARSFFPQLIPRLLWPGKPAERSPLLLITKTYGGYNIETSHSSIGLAADSYRAGGWWVVVAFAIFLGVFLAWLYARGPRRAWLPATVFYVILLTRYLRYDTEVTTLLINLFQFSVILWVLIRYVFFSPAPKNAGSSADKSL